ncbi:hypothetical protein [Streptomyces sp. NPDC093071]|uniref:hypothetical protein n=1 Tax=Streptomyces sp. NPDC093071 TaxID=3366022 RepID=UPI0037F19657
MLTGQVRHPTLRGGQGLQELVGVRASGNRLGRGVVHVLRKGALDQPLVAGLPTVVRIERPMNLVIRHTEQPGPDRATARTVGALELPGSDRDLLDDIFRLVFVLRLTARDRTSERQRV